VTLRRAGQRLRIPSPQRGRKAASLGSRELLANWLYGVAYKTLN
jgi:hypothetical protein